MGADDPLPLMTRIPDEVLLPIPVGAGRQGEDPCGIWATGESAEDHTLEGSSDSVATFSGEEDQCAKSSSTARIARG